MKFREFLKESNQFKTVDGGLKYKEVERYEEYEVKLKNGISLTFMLDGVIQDNSAIDELMQEMGMYTDVPKSMWDRMVKDEWSDLEDAITDRFRSISKVRIRGNVVSFD